MPLTPEQRTVIRSIFEDFLRQRIARVQELSITDLNINPFLIRLLAAQMGFQDTRSLVTWLVQQRLERGTVTAFGQAIQKVAQVFSEGTGVEGADIMKTKAGRHHYIQVKSGPNTIPKDMAARISQLLRSAQRRNRGSVALLGMTYGNPEQVSSIVRKYMEVDWLIGRKFWEFISDDPECMAEIYAIAGEVGDTFETEEGYTLAEVIEKKLDELTQEFEEEYGKELSDVWTHLLEKNS